MEIYSTEEQQVDAIKRFWRDNGMQIIAGAVIGLSGFIGWNWYVDQKVASQEAASDSFNTLASLTESNPSIGLQELDKELNQFVEQHGDSGYAILMQLIAAKQAVTKEEYTAAESYLQQAATQAQEPSLQGLILLRQARVQLQLEKYTEALSNLDKISSEAYLANVAELKGDIYFAQEQFDKARTEYQSAADIGGLDKNIWLKMKLDNLALSIQAQ